MAAEDYRTYVEHPRFGRGPRVTGQNPPPERPGSGCFGVHTLRKIEEIVPGTAVDADPSRQNGTPVFILSYCDLRRVCTDCRRPFLFFAEEQKHWYETLGFNIHADAVRCFPCRLRRRGVERKRKRYNELVSLRDIGAGQCVELAELTLDLIEAGAFAIHPRTLSRARMWLNRASQAGGDDGPSGAICTRIVTIRARIVGLERR